MIILFFFSHFSIKTRSGCSLEEPHQYTSNEYPEYMILRHRGASNEYIQHMFYGELEKIIQSHNYVVFKKSYPKC